MASGANSVCEIDLGYMTDVDAPMKYFILLVDVFNAYCWARPIPDRSKSSYEPALADILDKSGGFEIFVADQEFKHSEEFFEDRETILRLKPPGDHCYFAESKIGVIKRRLFLAIRGHQKPDWTPYLQNIVKGINR